MRRRLTMALVGVTLLAVLLVGLGVLFMARIGARAEAEDAVRAQLDSLAELVGESSLESLGPTIERTRSAFGFRDLAVVLVSPEGDVLVAVEAGETGDRDDRPARRPSRDVGYEGRLDDDQLDDFLDGDVVLIGEGRDEVVGYRSSGQELPSGLVVGIRAEQGVGRLPAAASTWFLASAAIVLALATALAAWLAGRFVEPIRRIEAATVAIARGDLDARTDVRSGPEELVQLAESVDTMAGDLQRSRAAEQQFLLSVSHDLRTPLTAISGYAEALADGAAPDPAAAGGVISHHAERLDRLVGDLLDLAKLDTDRFTLQPVEVDAAVVAGRVAAGFAPTAEADGVSIRSTGSTGAVVWADPDRLAQVITNLVDNATKFAATTVDVAVSRSAAGVSIAVVDDGPGIEAADQPYVFDRLYQSTAAPRRAENSSGLGLAIVRELVHAMGGEVALESEPGAGTTVRLTIPSPG